MIGEPVFASDRPNREERRMSTPASYNYIENRGEVPISANPEPEVSIVIGSYSRTKELLATIHSFLAQTWENFELLVVNDGPPCPEVMEAVCSIRDPRIRFLATSGRCNDWGNTSKEVGSHLSTGKYIGHSNDDNYYAPVYLEKMLDGLRTNDAQFAFCNMIHSYTDYMPFPTHPTVYQIDGGGWICRADIVRSTAWPEPKSSSCADGMYVEALVARCERIVKVPGYLFVHN